MSTAGMTFACALPREEQLARRHGNTIIVGLRCKLGIPKDAVTAYGFAGSLRSDWKPGTIISVVGVANLRGEVREVKPLEIPGAKYGVILGLDEPVADASVLEELRKSTGADAVHTETHLYTDLRGGILAVTDYPLRPLRKLATAIDDNGNLIWRNIGSAFLQEPINSALVSVNSLKAEWALRQLVL